MSCENLKLIKAYQGKQPKPSKTHLKERQKPKIKLSTTTMGPRKGGYQWLMSWVQHRQTYCCCGCRAMRRIGRFLRWSAAIEIIKYRWCFHWKSLDFVGFCSIFWMLSLWAKFPVRFGDCVTVSRREHMEALN